LILLYQFLIAADSTPLFGANTQLGINAGFVNSWTQFSQNLPGSQLESINRIGGGAYLWLQLGFGRIGIQAEVLSCTKGFDVRETYQGQDISSVYTIRYFEIPVLLSYRLFSHKKLQPVLLAGFYFGIPGKVWVAQTVEGQTEERELGDNLKQTDAGTVIGLDLRYRLKRICLVLAARYQHGLTNISRNTQAVSYDFDANDTIKNRSLSLMLGLALELGP
jgi:hypothetical protein